MLNTSNRYRRYNVAFIYLRGADTPVIASKVVRADSVKQALQVIKREYTVLKWLHVNSGTS